MSEATTLNLDDWVVRLTHKLAALADARQRALYFSNEITLEDPEAAVRHLRALLHRGFTQKGRIEKIAIETAMAAAAGGIWSHPHRRLTFDAALAEGDRLVSLMIGSEFLYDFPSEEVRLEVPSYREGHVLTLGERKSIAMKKDRRTILLALKDPSPKVIEKLLANPKLTESDVLAIAASRPVSREVLTVVGLHPKWRVSPRVAFALIMNPFTKPNISLSLIHNISRGDAETAAASALSRPLKEAFELILNL